MMSVVETSRPAHVEEPSVVTALLPLMLVVLIAFVVIGMALPVLPLHVHDGLKFGTGIVGLVTGSQFAASLASRFWSGRMCDDQGPMRAMMVGLAGATLAGLLYVVSVGLAGSPNVSVLVLLAGRAVLGAAESFIITGAIVWGMARVGAQNVGKVIAWMGTAMFAAFAGGAPLGSALYGVGGFGAVAAATVLAPLATMALVLPLRAAESDDKRSAGMVSVIRKIWLPGLGAALSSIGFGVIVTFGSLLFATRGWTPVWLAFTAYAVALIVARLLFGHLPDRIGGAKVALVCVAIEAAGLGLMAVATAAVPAAIGAALVGFGYALVFPRPWRRGRAAGAAGEPRRRNGRIHCLSRPRARRLGPGARIDRGRERHQRGVPSQCRGRFVGVAGLALAAEREAPSAGAGRAVSLAHCRIKMRSRSVAPSSAYICRIDATVCTSPWLQDQERNDDHAGPIRVGDFTPNDPRCQRGFGGNGRNPFGRSASEATDAN